MPTVNLTARVLDALRPDPTWEIDYWDASLPRFGVRVSPGGRKAWVVFYRHNGRARRMTLGVYPHMVLADAPYALALALHRVELGTDPAATKQEDRCGREDLNMHVVRKVQEI